jgi:hypothetical protein
MSHWPGILFPKDDKPKKYRPLSGKPIGQWADKTTWVCDCMVNLGYLQHGADDMSCPYCKCQRPLDL